MAMKDNNGNWLDPKGVAVPQRYVKPIDRKRDQVSEAILKDVEKLHDTMRSVKMKALKRMLSYDEFVAQETGVNPDKKGNIQITNFSGTVRVEYTVKDVIAFNDTLRSAKTLIDECLMAWTEGGHENLKVLVLKAFEVDKKGRINTSEILKLRSLNIKDEKWKRAMELIADSISISGTRSYLRVSHRLHPELPWESIDLNWSTI
jgi:hypothetical protein